MANLFISQGVIDTWVASDKVEVSGDVLTLRSGGTMRLQPASLFRTVSAGSDEPHHLLGKVKVQDSIARLGGEVYMTSVILGDTAYEIEPGFLATPSPGAHPRALWATVRALGGE